MERLPRSYYLNDTLYIAKDLLGKVIVHNSPEGLTAGRIVEVEAYIGPNDRASHAYKNLRSKRTAIQFGLGGYAYIYQIYGMYYCFNIVTQIENKPEVVLVRAVEPTIGIPMMMKRRRYSQSNRLKNLTNGPGKLCQALGIDKHLYGQDLCGDVLYLADDGFYASNSEITQTTRINIDYAAEDKDLPWRFYLTGNPYVSKVSKLP
ncbi:MAG: DNA-3-methyladenine glycosylase [Syntrophomonadaceae bacterium]|jgi:DNA-3-methyladenine glycosylase